MGKYVCGYCGKSYERIEDRMYCESECSKNNSEKKKLEEISIARKKLNDLRTNESALVSKLQTVKDEIHKTEKRIRTLTNMGECSEPQKANEKIKSTYELNGIPVSRDAFYDELGKFFDKIF